MKTFRERIRRLTPLSVAGYFFVLCLIAKGVFLYGSRHPSREALRVVTGTVAKARLGGDGSSTWLKITSESGTHRYSSYYGVVWPGMERIQVGDSVTVRAERNKLAKGEWLTGRQFYIWELTHRGDVVVAYENVRDLVEGGEATANRFVNAVLGVSFLLLLAASIHRLSRR